MAGVGKERVHGRHPSACEILATAARTQSPLSTTATHSLPPSRHLVREKKKTRKKRERTTSGTTIPFKHQVILAQRRAEDDIRHTGKGKNPDSIKGKKEEDSNPQTQVVVKSKAHFLIRKRPFSGPQRTKTRRVEQKGSTDERYGNDDKVQQAHAQGGNGATSTSTRPRGSPAPQRRRCSAGPKHTPLAHTANATRSPPPNLLISTHRAIPGAAATARVAVSTHCQLRWTHHSDRRSPLLPRALGFDSTNARAGIGDTIRARACVATRPAPHGQHPSPPQLARARRLPHALRSLLAPPKREETAKDEKRTLRTTNPSVVVFFASSLGLHPCESCVHTPSAPGYGFFPACIQSPDDLHAMRVDAGENGENGVKDVLLAHQ
ncbi:hypothetical protein DFH06DRAFT_1303274 [Mycena polygramma]|nr:hypothetical protein DFH06DRAFT_1303274 [Mycena polygramma]